MSYIKRILSIISSFLIIASAGVHAESGSYAINEDVIDLAPYVTTGTRTERILSEAPVKTELVMQSDFTRYNITSFQEALKLIPTARFESDCQNCGLNQIQLLGLSTDYTAILFDGAPLYSGLAKVYGADLFPSIFVDRIEVVKGGSSVLYGAEAIAGVVNLITARPEMDGAEIETIYSSLLGDAEEFESAFKLNQISEDEKFAVRVYGYYRDRDGLDLTTDGFTELPQLENKVLGTQFWWNPNDSASFKISYQYLDEAHRGGDRLDLPETQARVAESLAHKIHLANFSWEQSFTDSWDMDLRMSMIDIERKSFYGARGDNEQAAYEQAGNEGDVTEEFIESNQSLIDEVAQSVWGLTNNEVYYVDLQFNHYLKDHTISYGVQYRYEDLKDGSLYDSSKPETEDDFSNASIFVQDQWQLNERLEIVPGARLDDHDNVSDMVISPRLAMRYFAGEEWTLRASWSTGFNAPGAFNEDKHIGVNNGGAIFLVNAPDLEEESSQTFSFGFEYQPIALDQQMILHSQIHYTQLEDTFEIDDSGEASGSENLWLRINGPDSTIWVWENNISWQLTSHLRIDTGLSYIHARYETVIDRVTGLSTDEYLKRPEWTGHMGLSYENEDLFDVNAFLSYTGSMIAVGEDSDIWRDTPEFLVLDIGISKHFDLGWNHTELVLSLGVENAFDQRQKDQFNNGEDRDPTYLYGPTQPRTYYISGKLHW